MQFSGNDSARVPFSVIGVIMILMSAFTSAYLINMQSKEVSQTILDEREGGVNDALSLARSDINRALNYAGMYAQSNVGERPVVNASARISKSPDDINLDRIRCLTYTRFTDYLKSNFAGNSFVYGDYIINAEPAGGWDAVGIEPVTMELKRTIDSPIARCQKEYAAYYVISVPVRVNVREPHTQFNYYEEYTARALVTSRYPMLEELCNEYEARLNGTPLQVDVTGASFAYTLTRGYCQYATTEPMNIVDNSHLELIANGATLLEQGFVFNSVDPMGLASLMVRASGSGNVSVIEHINGEDYGPLNRYNISDNAENTIPDSYETYHPANYSFNADGIVDKALMDAFRGPGLKDIIDMSYSCEMHMRVYRSILGGGDNSSGKELISSRKYPDTSMPVIASEQWSVCPAGKSEMVTIEYVVDRYSFIGNSDNVISPFIAQDFSGYDDPNLAFAVESYRAAISRDVRFDDVLFDDVRYPDGCDALKTAFTAKRSPWVECKAMDDLYELSKIIKDDIYVSISADDYRPPQDMMTEACNAMEQQFDGRYDVYLSDERYMEGNKFKTCGSKSLYYIRKSFLDRVKAGLNESASSASLLNESIDREMSRYTGLLNSSDLSKSAGSSRSLLSNSLYIPFGLEMSLEREKEPGQNYSWDEKITLAIDQKPDYLCTSPYGDEATGYSAYPLKVRNVCLFSLPDGRAIPEESVSMILKGISAVYDAAGDTANETIMSCISDLAGDVASETRSAMKEEIKKALLTDTEMQGAVTDRDIEQAVDGAFRGRSDAQVVRDLGNGTIQREVAGCLASRARVEAEKRADTHVKEYGEYLASKTEAVAMDAGQNAVSSVLSDLRSRISNNFQEFIAAADNNAENDSIRTALKSIPMGVPLLPPYGYWATLNVWYIEMDGEIPEFTVYDADSEPVPDPIFGHKAISYTRRRDVSINDGAGVLGDNEPIRFHAETCTFILVPPGGTGIGDRVGGWDEKSPGYDKGGE